ncbi:MAG TPA: extracellular solute-binding protein [Levilinea sp.]|nr:extracellular solute-binding protein [Levilinea sp.]
MFKNRTLKFVLYVVLAASLLLSACQPAPAAPVAEDPAVPVAEEPEAPVAEEPAVPVAEEPAVPAKPSGNLVFMVQQANQDVFEQTVLDDFFAEYPDITIEWINHPPAEVANQVALAIQGGVGAPDLAVTETRSISRLVNLGGLVDLTAKVEPYLDRLNRPMMELTGADGKFYGVTWDIGPVVTFYRRDIFRAAGLPDDPESVSELVSTWDKYLETCMIIKDETGLPCFALNQANNYGDYFYNMLWSQGLGFTDADGRVAVNSPQHVATLEKLGEFWAADVVSDSLEWTDGWYAELNASIDDPHVQPVATIVIASWMGSFLKSWIALDQAGNWGVTYMPAFAEGGVRSANQGGSAFFIPEQSTNKEAAWAFIEFMILRDENHLAIFEYSDYFPALESIYGAPLFSQPDPYFADQPTRLIYAEAARQIPLSTLYGVYAIPMTAATTTAIQRFAMGEMSAQAALDEAADAIRLETGLE